MTSGRMKPKDTKKLVELRESMVERFARLAANKRRFTLYRCTHCRHKIPTECPEVGDTGSKGYWDSLTTCLACGEMNFVFVWPTGRTVARKFPPVEGEPLEDAEMRHVPSTFEVISHATLK